MMKLPREWNDTRIEIVIGGMLRTGVLLATFVVLAGAAIYLLKYGRTMPHYAVFTGEPADLRDLPGILTAALNLRGRGIIQLGLLMLVATPVARVAFSVVAFALERDYLYVLITIVVLSILAFSLFGEAMVLAR
jgi:uncharacterized membrane protein